MREGFFPGTAMPDADWWQTLWPQPGEVLATLGLQREMDAVDLCCGNGLFTIPLAGLARHVLAIDLDPDLIGLAQARATAAGLANAAFVVADAYDLARLMRAPVDFVLIANTFHGVPDQARLARAVATVLRPRGRFAVVNWHRRPREETVVLGEPRGPKTELRMGPEEVAAAVAPCGLRPLQVIQLPPYHYASILGLPA